MYGICIEQGHCFFVIECSEYVVEVLVYWVFVDSFPIECCDCESVLIRDVLNVRVHPRFDASKQQTCVSTLKMSGASEISMSVLDDIRTFLDSPLLSGDFVSLSRSLDYYVKVFLISDWSPPIIG